MSDYGQMTDPMKKALERKGRRTVAERVALYYHSLSDRLETDAEGFFDRVMQIDAQRRSAATPRH